MTDSLDRLKTALADRYTIERELGSGGMATVYLAHDIRHDRKVAVKVLRPELAAVLGAERFLNEIRVTANLQHPHILPLFDSGEADGFLFYVMPHVEGESLLDRLEREKQLSVSEAVELTKGVASALDYAHRHDVIHRDIKPGNILLQDGQAMVADFGIALAVTAAGGDRITETGLSLGTPEYMSPEQATGDRQVDARSDLYSLAAMLYEMLTGEPPHSGKTVQAIIAKVVTDRPRPVKELRDTVPVHVEAAIDQALEKLPADRFGSAAEFAAALDDPSATLARQSIASIRQLTIRDGGRGWALPTVGLIAAIAVVFAVWGWLRSTPPEPTMRFGITLPPEHSIADVPDRTFAISPDGSLIVFSGTVAGESRIYLREINELEAQPLAGTELGSSPFFSPDGRWIGFVADQSVLKRVPLAGGAPITIVEVGGPIRGASWGVDDMILFTPTTRAALHVVPASGGETTAITALDSAAGDLSHRWPQILPGGGAAIFTNGVGNPSESRIGVVNLRTGETRYVAEGSGAQYVASGHLVYGVSGGVLLAAPFDLGKLDVTGPAFGAVDGAVVKTFTGAAEFSVAQNGALIYAAGREEGFAMVLVDRDGGERVLEAPDARYAEPRFSPDGRHVVVRIQEAGPDQVWLYDVERAILTPLTSDGDNRYPAWSPDGQQVTFTSDQSGTLASTEEVCAPGEPCPSRSAATLGLYAVRWDGSGSMRPLLTPTSRHVWEGEWAPDYRRLVYRTTENSTGRQAIWVFDRETEESQPFVETMSGVVSPAVSPNGRWLAYSSGESGRFEVLVRTFPDPTGARLQVSAGGGEEPVWGPDSRELFYRSGDRIVSVFLDGAGSGERTVLFTGPYVRNSNHANYDVHPSGSHFVMIRRGVGGGRLIYVHNWVEELRRQGEGTTN